MAGKQKTVKPPSSVLISSIRLIGDVILSTPLIGLLKAAWPDVEIDMLVNQGMGEFLEKDPRVRRIYYSSKGEGRYAGGRQKSYLPAIARQYDIAITMNPADRGNIAVKIAGRNRRIGFIDDSKGLKRLTKQFFLTDVLPLDEDRHVVLRCMDIAEALEIHRLPLEVRIFWDDQDSLKVADTVGRHLAGSNGYFVIHPFARWRYKYWDTERFCGISDRLASRYSMQPVWTSSPDPDETALLESAASGCSIKPLIVPGQFTLNQMACLLHGARLYIGLDTAITHLAAATGIPVIALYGPTEIWRWYPWNNSGSRQHETATAGYRGRVCNGQIVALQSKCSHKPCIRPGCYISSENPCMMRITADEVYNEAARLMDSLEMRQTGSAA